MNLFMIKLLHFIQKQIKALLKIKLNGNLLTLFPTHLYISVL